MPRRAAEPRTSGGGMRSHLFHTPPPTASASATSLHHLAYPIPSLTPPPREKQQQGCRVLAVRAAPSTWCPIHHPGAAQGHLALSSPAPLWWWRVHQRAPHPYPRAATPRQQRPIPAPDDVCGSAHTRLRHCAVDGAASSSAQARRWPARLQTGHRRDGRWCVHAWGSLSPLVVSSVLWAHQDSQR